MEGDDIEPCLLYQPGASGKIRTDCLWVVQGPDVD